MAPPGWIVPCRAATRTTAARLGVARILGDPQDHDERRGRSGRSGSAAGGAQQNKQHQGSAGEAQTEPSVLE